MSKKILRLNKDSISPEFREQVGKELMLMLEFVKSELQTCGEIVGIRWIPDENADCTAETKIEENGSAFTTVYQTMYPGRVFHTVLHEVIHWRLYIAIMVAYDENQRLLIERWKHHFLKTYRDAERGIAEKAFDEVLNHLQNYVNRKAYRDSEELAEILTNVLEQFLVPRFLAKHGDQIKVCKPTPPKLTIQAYNQKLKVMLSAKLA